MLDKYQADNKVSEPRRQAVTSNRADRQTDKPGACLQAVREREGNCRRGFPLSHASSININAIQLIIIISLSSYAGDLPLIFVN